MARKLTIPVDDHNDGSTCSLSYTVKYKLSSEPNWSYLISQQPVETGSPAFYALLVRNLEDDVSYDYEVIRNCCEGTTSVAASGTIVTTP